ncbi:MAG: hydantoinase B/oxoprolinase family protein, partial [Proteobacteria bacterium]|nr:hydantoinase B/oxoprolinase family protein [Pseudomonadota bacterium]
MSRAGIDPITLEILWTRLVSLVDEAAATYVRTAFSTLVQESNDYAVVLTDVKGRALAQSSLSIPSFIGTLPRTVRHLGERFPVESLKPGDVLITNDPWLGTGHLPDINIVTPVFRRGRAVAFAAITSHMPDIGGRTWNAGIRELYEEGLQIPPVKLIAAGRVNQTVVDFIRQNVRVPDLTMGDVWGEVSACRMLGGRLLALLDESGID